MRQLANFGILPRPVSATVARLSVSTNSLGSTERPEWAAAAAVTVYGVRVGIRTDDPALLPKLRAHLPPASRASRTEDVDLLYSMRIGPRSSEDVDRAPVYRGYSGDVPFVETSDETAALDALEGAVTFDVAAASTRWVFVHAGVVAWEGRAIVIPAPSMSGKSTLVDALVRAGATYYSDEYAVLDAQGLVHPFRIRLSLRDAAREGQAVKRRVPPDRARARALPIGLVVATRHEANAGWQPRRGTAGEAVLALLSNTVRARLAPGLSLKVLARAVEGAVLLEGSRGEADRVAPRLLEELR